VKLARVVAGHEAQVRVKLAHHARPDKGAGAARVADCGLAAPYASDGLQRVHERRRARSDLGGALSCDGQHAIRLGGRGESQHAVHVLVREQGRLLVHRLGERGQQVAGPTRQQQLQQRGARLTQHPRRHCRRDRAQRLDAMVDDRGQPDETRGERDGGGLRRGAGQRNQSRRRAEKGHEGRRRVPPRGRGAPTQRGRWIHGALKGGHRALTRRHCHRPARIAHSVGDLEHGGDGGEPAGDGVAGEERVVARALGLGQRLAHCVASGRARAHPRDFSRANKSRAEHAPSAVGIAACFREGSAERSAENHGDLGVAAAC
jgi:hypothetical protein